MALLEVDEVVVRFGGVTAVDRASFTVEPGTITGLIGPNGAGKTTLFNVITGMQPAVEGRIRLDGNDLGGAGVHARARLGIGRTFQRLEAFGSLSVYDNVLTAAEIHKRWRRAADEPRSCAARWIERVGIGGFATHQADAVPTGVARLLELARALSIDPRVLLLDEPSSGLGDDETERFGALLRELADDGRAILMVEHDMGLVMTVCDTIHVLEFGRVIASGTPAQVRSDPLVQEAYLGALSAGDSPEEER